jgi:hypothetical protein
MGKNDAQKKTVYIETSIVSCLTAKPSTDLLATAWQMAINFQKTVHLSNGLFTIEISCPCHLPVCIFPRNYPNYESLKLRFFIRPPLLENYSIVTSPDSPKIFRTFEFLYIHNLPFTVLDKFPCNHLPVRGREFSEIPLRWKR